MRKWQRVYLRRIPEYREHLSGEPQRVREEISMDGWEALYEKALRIAGTAHEGQYDKGGTPYILHPVTVAEKVEGPEAKITALLHDVVEDTDVTLEELSAVFPPVIVEAVDRLTKKKGSQYSLDKYLEGVKENEIARKVKLADLEHNMDLSRIPNPTWEDYRRQEKYKRCMEFLLGKG